MSAYDVFRNQYWRDPAISFTIHEVYTLEGGRQLIYKPIIAISEDETGPDTHRSGGRGRGGGDGSGAPRHLRRLRHAGRRELALPGLRASWASSLDWDSLLAEKKLAFERGELSEE